MPSGNYFYNYYQTIIPPVLTKFRLIHPGNIEGGNRVLELKSQPSSNVSTNSYTNRSNYYYYSDANKHKIFLKFYEEHELKFLLFKEKEVVGGYGC